jgi:hypothetical protein
MRRVLATIDALENTITITYSECVFVALVIKHVKRIRRVILSSVVCLSPHYFSALSHKRHDYRKKS